VCVQLIGAAMFPMQSCNGDFYIAIRPNRTIYSHRIHVGILHFIKKFLNMNCIFSYILFLKRTVYDEYKNFNFYTCFLFVGCI
jgi:hypothetical protein